MFVCESCCDYCINSQKCLAVGFNASVADIGEHEKFYIVATAPKMDI